MPYVVEHFIAEEHKRFQIDRYGYFVITLIDGRIVTDYYAKRMPVYRIIGDTAKEIRDTVDKLGLINPKFKHFTQHAIYVGMELQKAELALKNGLAYIQDDPLTLR